MRGALFLVGLLWSSSLSSVELVSAIAVYNVSDGGLKSVTITVSGPSLTGSKLVILPLPFHVGSTVWNQSEIVGVINHDEYALALIELSPKAPSLHFTVPIDSRNPLTNGVSLRQLAYGDLLLVPSISEQAIRHASDLADVTGGIAVRDFMSVQAQLEAGFIILSDATEEKLLNFKILPMERNKFGAYQLAFRRPESLVEEAVQSSAGALLLAALGLLLAYAAPGLLPEGPAATIVMAATVALSVFLVAMRWWFASRSRQAFVSAISDTSVTILYIAGLGIVWLMRRRRNKSNASKGYLVPDPKK
jgi:hypothetical protein